MDYYYLIASLPELSLEQPFPSIDVDNTLSFITGNLNEEDLKLSKYLIFPNDNKNLTNSILDKYHKITLAEYKSPSNFSGEDILASLMQGNLYNAPNYMLRYIANYKDKFDLLRPSRIEEYLWLEFYNELETLDNTFIIEYYQFDKTLRQLATVRNSQLYDDSPLSEFVNDAINRQLEISKPETVLAKTYPFISDLWSALDGRDPLTIEKTMDRIRWKFIDEYELYENFSSNQVFGWIIKLVHYSRWASLSSEKGRIRCLELCDNALKVSGISELENL